MKQDQSRTWPVLCQDRFIYEISTQYVERWQRKVRKKKFLQRAITHVKTGQTQPKSNFTCIMSRQIHIWNFNSICWKMTKKSPENEIFAKGNNSCNSRSNATSQTWSVLCEDKSIYQISSQYLRGRLRKVRKTEWTDTEWTDWRTDGRTDGWTDGQSDRRQGNL